MIEKKIRVQEKRMLDDEDRKKKENRRVVAKIRYNEWAERKAEEARHSRAL